jgi:hypothetical protein
MRQRPWPEAFVLGLLPVLVWTAAPIQLFPPPGWVDPGLYLGYFLNLPILLHRFGPDYHGMRLPWVLSGLIVHQFLSPSVAQLVLVFGFHLLSVISLYLIVMPRHGRLVGLLSTLFLTFNPAWIGAVTRGYVDGPAIAFQFASIAVVMNVDRFRTIWTAGLLEGLFASLAFYTHPVVGAFTGVAYLACLVAQRTRWRTVIQMSSGVVVGFAASTIALGLASRFFGGPFLFPLVSVDFGRRALSGFGLAYRRPIGEWLPAAYMLFPPLSLLCSGLASLPTRSGPSALLKAGCGVLGASLSAFVIWDLVVGGSYLQTSFGLTFLIPGQALVFSGLMAQIGASVHDFTRRIHSRLTAGLLVAGLVPLTIVQPLWNAEQHARPLFGIWMVLIVITIAAAAALRTRGAAAAPVLLLLATTLSGVLNADTRRMFRVDGNRDYRAFYRATHRVNAFIRGNLNPERTLLIWYNRDEFTTGHAEVDDWMHYRMSYQGQPLVLSPYDSFSSLWLWNRSTLNFAMPELTRADLARLDQPVPVTLVMFCQKVARCEDGWKALERNGYSVRVRSQTRIVEPTYIDVIVTAVEAEHRASTPIP